MIGLAKLICLSFAWITLLAVSGAVICSWVALSPKATTATIEKYSERVFQCVRVAQWTLIAAGVSGMVWCAFECLEYAWCLE